MLCHKWCTHTTHPFLYRLTEDDKTYLQKYPDEKTVSVSGFIGPREQLAEFFESHPKTDYFIRLSTISPKDAYWLANQTDEGSDDDEPMTLEDIQNEIGFLRVGVPSRGSVEAAVAHCLMLMTVSERIQFEIKFNPEEDFSLVLFEWDEINHRTETRCYIRDGRVIGISQYYVDLTGCYSEFDTDELKIRMVEFCNQYTKENGHLTTCSLDLTILPDGRIKLIESNSLKESDPCLFTREELELGSGSDYPVEFRFRSRPLTEPEVEPAARPPVPPSAAS